MLKSINLNKLISASLISFFMFVVMLSGVAYAVVCPEGQIPGPGGQGCVNFVPSSDTGDITTKDNFDKTQLTTTITGVVNYIIGIVAIIAVVMIVYAGYLYIMAGADEKNVDKAKKMLLYGVIGVVVVILSYSIVSFANSFLTA